MRNQICTKKMAESMKILFVSEFLVGSIKRADDMRNLVAYHARSLCNLIPPRLGRYRITQRARMRLASYSPAGS